MVHFCWRGNRCDIDISLLACNFRNLLDDRDIILGRMHNIVPKLTKLTICKTHMSTAQNLTSRVHFWSPGNRCGHSFFLSVCNFWHELHYRGIISGRVQNIIPKLSKSPVCKTHISPAQNLTSRVYFCSPGSWRGRSFFLSECNFRLSLHYTSIRYCNGIVCH